MVLFAGHRYTIAVAPWDGYSLLGCMDRWHSRKCSFCKPHDVHSVGAVTIVLPEVDTFGKNAKMTTPSP